MFNSLPVIYSMILLGLHFDCNERLLHLQYRSSNKQNSKKHQYQILILLTQFIFFSYYSSVSHFQEGVRILE